MAHCTALDALQVLELVGADAPPDQSHQLALNACQVIWPIADLAHPAMLLNISSTLSDRSAVADWPLMQHSGVICNSEPDADWCNCRRECLEAGSWLLVLCDEQLGLSTKQCS